QLCGLKGIKREFSILRTSQQNGIAERKNKNLIEAARTVLADSLPPIHFWVEAVNTACYVQNKVLVTKPHNKTPYELLHGRLPSIGFMRPFGCPVTILNTLDPLGKFHRKVDEGFLVGYPVCKNQTNSNAGFQDTEKSGEEGTQTYKSMSPDIHSSSFGDQTKEQGDKSENKDKVMMLMLLVLRFSAVGPSNAAMPNLEDLSHNADDVGAEADTNNMESIISVSPIPTTRIYKDHLTSQIIGDLSSTTQTRSMARGVRDQELLDNYSLSLPANESYHFDIPSPYRPPAKPPDGKTGTWNIKIMGDVSDQKVPIPNLTITRVLNQEKSPDLLSHQGFEAFHPSTECSMIINGKNILLLDVPLFHFYPLDQLKYGGN
nr:retrovirus-related Pol polyprotein from transposon TNT 1-94 [Tanacetum cinerariifolium]